MESLGLSDIEKLRKDLKCREGLLIDFDYGALISDITNQEHVDSGLQSIVEEGGGSQSYESYDAPAPAPGRAPFRLHSIGEEGEEIQSYESYVAPVPAPGRNPGDPSGARTVCFSHI